MPRSAFAFPGDELCGALQGGIAYLVMWTQGAEAQATSTAIALDQRIWTSLWSHTQVRHKNTRAYIRRCAHACAHGGYFDWKKGEDSLFLSNDPLFWKAAVCCGRQDHRTRLSVGSCVRSLIWTLFYWGGEMKVGAPTPEQGIVGLLLCKELFKNKPQTKIQTMLLCPARFASVALTLVPAFAWGCTRVHASAVQNKQVPPSRPHLNRFI